MRSNSSNVNKFNKQQRVIRVTAAERTRGRDEAAHIARLLVSGNYTERGTYERGTYTERGGRLYAIPATSLQILGLVDRQACIQII